MQFNKESMQLLLLHDQEITFCVPTVVAQIIPLKTVGFFMDILKAGLTPHQEEAVAVEVAEVAVEAPPARANNTTAAAQDYPDQIPGVSKETWSAIVNLLKPSNTSTEKLSGKHMNVDFLLDSGASHHITGDVDLLTDLCEIPRSIIVLPNGKHTYATKEGSLHLGGDRTLTHVLFVPDLSCTLISLARLLRELSCFAIFIDKLCVIHDLCSKMPIGAGEEENGVYHFRGIVPA